MISECYQLEHKSQICFDDRRYLSFDERSELERELVSIIRAAPGLTRTMVCRRASRSVGLVNRHLYKLEQAGRIVKTMRGCHETFTVKETCE